MANRRIKRLLLAITMLAAIFAYSCGTCPRYYNAIIAKANGISYTSLYPEATMEPRGYFLNEMAQYGEQYGEDICNHYINNLSEEERNLYIKQAEDNGYKEAITYCINNNKQGSFYGDAYEIKDWLKSMNTPFYNDIASEIFVEKNYRFLGFYQADEQEYYIFVNEEVMTCE
ncbi:MAG: hypothetical protein LBC75_13230 [Fibromonadaceae bacterium]|nr:hypothetical protein [Fibromonadaceae bacterium]